MNTYIKIKKVKANAITPKYGSDDAVCADLYACLDYDVAINPGETKLVPTGISIETPVGLGAFIFARSGLATKQGLAPANKVGVVDPDYRGEIMVALHNHSNDVRVVNNGDRVAQLGFIPYVIGKFMEVDELNDTNRGAGGFGSTGSN